MVSGNNKGEVDRVLSAPQQQHLLTELVLPLFILLLLTLIFRYTDLDMQIARLLYLEGDGWRFSDFWLWQTLYEYGYIPGAIIGLVGLGGLLLGLRSIRIRWNWRAYLLLLLLLATGPGLLVEGMKDIWERPRPRHVIEFGGSIPFVKVWDIGHQGDVRSFPSGHSAIGFYVMAPFFILRRRRLAKGFLVGGTLYGALMGAGRLAQGGHFLSDIIWAWGIIYLTGLLLRYLLKPEMEQ